MGQIIGVHAREILDSRGNPTVEVEVTTASGAVVVPPFLLELRPVKTKHSSFVTVTKIVMAEKAY